MAKKTDLEKLAKLINKYHEHNLVDVLIDALETYDDDDIKSIKDLNEYLKIGVSGLK